MHLSIFHNDIEEFINSKKVNADEKLRLKTLSTAIIIPDKFMELLRDNNSKYYYTFYPKNVYDTFGVELTDMDMSEWYDKLVKDKRIRKTQRNKISIIQEIMKSQKESGFSYLTFIDNMNKVHNLREIGRINMSNLCVALYTKILTKEYGYIEIEKVEDKEVHIWNGEEWSKVTVKRTGKDKDLIRINTNIGIIDCTYYHKFYLENGNEVRAINLKQGDKLIQFNLPNNELVNPTVLDTMLLDKKSDVFCFTEQKRNMGVFNGILTGNCQEIAQLNKPNKFADNIYSGNNEWGYDIQCVLSSLNLVNLFDCKTDEERKNVIISSIKFLSNVSDISHLESVPSVNKANDDFHSVGLGVLGLHTLLVKLGIEYESEEAKDLCNVLFSYIRYYSLYGSMLVAKERGKFKNFEKSDYYKGKALYKYYSGELDITPKTDRIKELLGRIDIYIPTKEDWNWLNNEIHKYGLYNAYQNAIAPNQSSAYIMEVSSSLQPVSSEVEFRDYGHLQTVYPQALLTNENKYLYKSAYDINQLKYMELMATVQEHIDQAISITVFINSDTKLKEQLAIIIKAWQLGIKTLYYWRTRKQSIMADKEPICESCSV